MSTPAVRPSNAHAWIVAQHAVAAVVEHAHDHRQLILRGGRELADVQHEAAVALDDDGLLAGGDGRADGERQPGTDGRDVVRSEVRGVNIGSSRLPQMYAGTVASLTMLPCRGNSRRIASMMRS